MYKYVRVGSWEIGQFFMNEFFIYWLFSGFGSEVEFVCSDLCIKGLVKVCKLFVVWYMYFICIYYKYIVQ